MFGVIQHRDRKMQMDCFQALKSTIIAVVQRMLAGFRRLTVSHGFVDMWRLGIFSPISLVFGDFLWLSTTF